MKRHNQTKFQNNYKPFYRNLNISTGDKQRYRRISSHELDWPVERVKLKAHTNKDNHTNDYQFKITRIIAYMQT